MEKDLEVEKKLSSRLVGRGGFIVKLMKLKFQNLSFALLSRLSTKFYIIFLKEGHSNCVRFRPHKMTPYREPVEKRNMIR